MTDERERLPSVSSALVLAVAIGAVEALALFWACGPLLSIMGIQPVGFSFSLKNGSSLR